MEVLMKKFIPLVICMLVVLTLAMVTNSDAKSSYGEDVDSFCIDSNPSAGDCLLCHASNSKSTQTKEMDLYLAGDLCYFCPNDSTCSGPACTDVDYDGFYAESGCGTLVDCNDNDSAINPWMNEICNDSIDNDCDGNIDAQDPACGTFDCTDTDGDGFSVEGDLCGPMDCNDSDPEIYPGAIDTCNDSIDQDCSGKDRTKGKGCKTTSTQSEGKGKTCSDGLDNDNNGLTDCADDGCSRNRACR